ncbi:hypothetical protein DFH08DRAFT_857998 [Mycena albidolilacea]|uniref:Uncharacterized protein n=1 Tax=Mycena albidolilacea TaxID=1033008 RepID=A0AAD7A8J1_9AGAR|nr:hypothetical protein DFH08DRAFT_857998 [Mycena albidolilacea]
MIFLVRRVAQIGFVVRSGVVLCRVPLVLQPASSYLVSFSARRFLVSAHFAPVCRGGRHPSSAYRVVAGHDNVDWELRSLLDVGGQAHEQVAPVR